MINPEDVHIAQKYYPPKADRPD